MLFYAPSAPHLVYAAPSPSPSPFSSPSHAYGLPIPRTCRQERSDILSSRKRYVRAQAEMRAAEAAYAASVARAREEARLREQQQQQQQRQRALQDEILIARALQIQAERVRRQQAVDAERRRAELVRRRLLWDASVHGELDGEEVSLVEPRRRVVRYPFAASRAREAVRPDFEESPLVGLDDILQILHAVDQRQQAPIADPHPPTVPTPPPTASAPLPTPQPKHDAKGKGKARDPSPGADPSLQSRLEERPAHGSSDAEIEETVRSLIASLFGEDARSAPAPARASAAGEPSSSKVKLAPDARATRAASVDHPTPTAAATATATSSPASRAPTPTPTSGLDAVTAIESSFRALQHDFAFPSTLDFDAPPALSPTTSPTSAAPAAGSAGAAQDYVLAYTPANAPVRAYEHALSALLARLDAVESDGDEAVRGRRRGVVRDVERALDEVDRVVGERRAERAGRRAVRAEADTGERAVESAVTTGESGRVDLEVGEAVSADAALAVQHTTTPTPSPLHDGAEIFVEVDPAVASAPDVEAAAELSSATSESADVLAPAAVEPASVDTPEAVPQDVQLSALASSIETAQAKPTDSAPLTPDADIMHVSSASQPPSSPSEAEAKLDTTEPPVPAPSTRPSPPTPSPLTSSDAAEDYLSSLSHAQFTFPPRRDLSAEEPEDAVLVESDVGRSSVEDSNTSESESERDAWSEVEA